MMNLYNNSIRRLVQTSLSYSHASSSPVSSIRYLSSVSSASKTTTKSREFTKTQDFRKRKSFNEARNQTIGDVKFSDIKFRDLIQKNKLVDYILSFHKESENNKTELNELIDFYLKSVKNPEVTLELFNALEKKNFFYNNIFAINRFMDSFRLIHDHPESKQKLLEVWNKLSREQYGIKSNIKSFNILIEYYLDLKQLEEAKKVISELYSKKELFFSNYTLDLLIRFNLDQGRVDFALDTLKKIDRANIHHYSWVIERAISHYIGVGNNEAALNLLNGYVEQIPKILSTNLISNVYRIIFEISGYDGISTYEKFLHSTDSYNKMIEFLMSTQNMDKIAELYQRMQEAEIVPNDLTYALFINHYSQGQKPMFVQRWVDSYIDHVKPSNTILLLIMEHYRRGIYFAGMNRMAKVLVNSPNVYDITNTIIYLSGIDGYVNTFIHDLDQKNEPKVEERKEKEFNKREDKSNGKLPCPPSREVIWRALSKKENEEKKIRVIGQLIQHYLCKNDYKSAIQLNLQRVQELKLAPNLFIIKSFWAFHQIHQQTELADYWINEARKEGIELSEDDKKQAIEYFKSYNVEEKTKPFEKLFDSLKFTINYKNDELNQFLNHNKKN